MSLAVQKTMRVEPVTTEAKLLSLREAWTALLSEIPTAPIFLTWEWISTWWRHFGQNRELWVLTAWDEAGQLTGIAPWMLVRNSLGPPLLRRIVFIASGVVAPDHLDIIARPNEKDAICRAFVTYLDTQRVKWDILDLQGLVQHSALKAHLANGDGRYLEREKFSCPFITLPDGWDTYQMNSLSANRRQQLRRRRRQLEKDYPGQVVFHQITQAQELSAGFDSLIKLNQARWNDKGDITSFNNSQFVEFHREMARLALQQGWLRLYQLKVADQVIGVQYCFCYRNVFYDYQRGFDPAWNKYSPGHLLLAHIIQEAIKEGARKVDMLRGVEQYKYSWTDQVQTDSNILFSRKWPGHLWLFGTAILDGAKPIGRRALPQPLQQKIGQFLAGI